MIIWIGSESNRMQMQKSRIPKRTIHERKANRGKACKVNRLKFQNTTDNSYMNRTLFKVNSLLFRILVRVTIKDILRKARVSDSIHMRRKIRV